MEVRNAQDGAGWFGVGGRRRGRGRGVCGGGSACWWWDGVSRYRENFPDAVTAGAAGGAADGPVLLVRQNSIPTFTFDELNRLLPFKIVIVGGTAVISVGVEDQLKALSFGPIVLRRGGADRYETAALLSQDTFPKTGAASCPGVGFFPHTSDDPFSGVSPRIAPIGDVSFCELSLPHGATVTKFTAGMDVTSDIGAVLCAFVRVDIAGGREGAGIGTLLNTAITSPTMGRGGQALSTTLIAEPVVNNARYGYFASCGTGTGVGIVGVTVEYELTG